MVKKPVRKTKEDNGLAIFVETTVKNMNEADWKEGEGKMEETIIVDRTL
jgi:hypothetical protein